MENLDEIIAESFRAQDQQGYSMANNSSREITRNSPKRNNKRKFSFAALSFDEVKKAIKDND